MNLSLIASLDQADPARAEFDETRDAAADEAFGEGWRDRDRFVSEDDVEGGYVEPADEREDAAFDAWHEAQMAQWDDDPNPYLGTYSEE